MAIQWKIILNVVGALLAALTAWETRQKRKHFDQKFLKAVDGHGVLEAVLIQEREEGEICVTGRIEKKDELYYLEIRQTGGKGSRITVAETFSDHNTIEKYLEAETILRLSDFKRANKSNSSAIASGGR